jgi:glycosyltransferase involved in cell wall biosynthesis
MIQDHPLVSVIIPAFNAEKSISETINSVLDQEWKNLEVIVVNDGSTDNTHGSIEKFLTDARVHYIKQENRGCSAAKNTGLANAKGDFIQYLDADDILSSDKIKTQVELLSIHENSIAVCRTMVFNESINESNLREIDTPLLQKTSVPIDFLLHLNGISGVDGMVQPNAFLMPRKIADVIGPWDETLSPNPDEDSEYFCRAILAADKILFTEQGINYYRSDPKAISLSRNHNPVRINNAVRVIEKKGQHLLKYENSKRVKEVIAFQYSLLLYKYFNVFPELLPLCEKKINGLGISTIPVSGGNKFRALARMTSMKACLKIRRRLTN